MLDGQQEVRRASSSDAGTLARLLYDFNTLGGEPILNRPLTLLTADGKVTYPKLKGGTEWCSAFTSELQVAVDGVAGVVRWMR